MTLKRGKAQAVDCQEDDGADDAVANQGDLGVITLHDPVVHQTKEGIHDEPEKSGRAKMLNGPECVIPLVELFKGVFESKPVEAETH